MARTLAVGLLVTLVVAAGCSGSREEPSGRGPSAAATAGIDAASRLDLDNGRVSVFSPQGWRRAPRSYDYLVRYQSTPQLPYPAVVVLAADPPAGIVEVTADTHAAFVEAISAALAETAGKSVLRKPARATVGPHRAVTWAAAGEATIDGPPKKIERECTAVVIDGRLYSVEAWAPRGKLTDAGRTPARAVAAALAVPSLDEVEPLLPAEPQPAATDPAEPTEGEPQTGDPAPAEPEPAADAAAGS